MRNSNRGNDLPPVRRIQRVELSESNVKLRMILIVVLLAVATVSIGVALSSALKTEPGWQRIQVQSAKANCNDDFLLEYDFTDAGSAASDGYKKLTTLYSTACEDAYRIFSPDVQDGVFANVHDLNARPNEVVTVESALYRAFELLQQYENRNLYLAPVYTEYDHIFRSESEAEAASYDPAQNPELVADMEHLAAFANDPSMIDIQLLGNNQVKLTVSEEYLTFVRENEIEKLIDFGWMKNAFIADYLAQILADNGFTNGYIASFDGYTRNLDKRGNDYSVNIFHRAGPDIYQSAVMRYTAPSAIVFLRDYPMSKADVWHYYAFQNGRMANMLIDPKDGMCKASVDGLTAYSADQGCAEVLLQMIPVFISDEFSQDALQKLASNGVHSIWCEEQKVLYTDKLINLTVSPQSDISYEKVFAG